MKLSFFDRVSITIPLVIAGATCHYADATLLGVVAVVFVFACVGYANWHLDEVSKRG